MTEKREYKAGHTPMRGPEAEGTREDGPRTLKGPGRNCWSTAGAIMCPS